jgi:hypothetical protein
MKGSITFKFGGEFDPYGVRVAREGDLDQLDLVAIAMMLADNIRHLKLIALGQIQSTPSDPSGIRQFNEHWSN